MTALDYLALYALFLLLTAAIYLTEAIRTPAFEGRGIPLACKSLAMAGATILAIKLCLM